MSVAPPGSGRHRTALLASALVLAACSEIPVNEGTVFVPADSASWLEPDELVLGLSLDGQTRAYPISALSPIEVLNDVVGDTPVAVTWCPLSATGAVFSSQVEGQPRRFRFHPDLYKMNLLFEDVETGSIWSQLASLAVDGPDQGGRLVQLPTIQMPWSEWLRTHPETTVLRPDWGTVRFVYRLPRREPPPRSRADQELVLVVDRGIETRAYPFSDLSRAGGTVSDVIDGVSLQLHFKDRGPTAFATDSGGNPSPAMVIYWKYLGEFFPEAEVWDATAEDSDPTDAVSG